MCRSLHGCVLACQQLHVPPPLPPLVQLSCFSLPYCACTLLLGHRVISAFHNIEAVMLAFLVTAVAVVSIAIFARFAKMS